MNRNFLIKDVEISNFRGYPRKKFEFFKNKEDYQGLILLGGPNGYGKTSLLDAIEWCFTGTVRRLKEDFVMRKDRNNKLLKSLIRNNPNEVDVWVKVTAFFNNEQIELKRVFNNSDESKAFDSQNSFFTVDDHILEQNNTIDSIIGKSIAADFYDRFTCSYEKNITIYEKNRTDIYAMFSSFLGGTNDIQVAISKLEGDGGVIEKLETQLNADLMPNNEKIIEAYQSMKNKLDVLLTEKEAHGNIANLINEYPKEKAYKDEIFPSFSENESGGTLEKKLNQLKDQNIILKKLKYLKKYSTAFEESKTYKADLEKVSKYNRFMDQVYRPYILKEEDIQNVQGENLEVINIEKERLKSIKSKLIRLKEPTKGGASKLLELSEGLVDLDHELFVRFGKVDSLFESRELLTNQLEEFKTQDKSLKAMRVLIDNTEGFEKHRESDYIECPLCGSDENFPIKELELAKVAKNVLGEFDERRAELQKQYEYSDAQLKELYKKFYDYVLDDIEKKLLELITIINNFTNLKSYISNCAYFSININDLNITFLEEKKTELRNQLKENKVLKTLETNILEQLVNEQGALLGVTNHHNEGQLLSIKEFRIFNVDDKIISITQFIDHFQDAIESIAIDYVLDDMKLQFLLDKISILDRLIKTLESDNEIQSVTAKIDEQKKSLDDSDKLFKRRKKELDEFKRILRGLKGLRVQWDKDRVEEIKEPLQKIYRRINRHTNIKDINLLVEGRTNSIAGLWAKTEEEEEVFAPNILSAGQLSVVALAIFISVALGQKESPFKCYFMDDPIQTMDDLNILSFIDLLRAELAPKNQMENQFVDQLFFTTCDEKLERLISHKMKNFGVNFSHIHFTGYGNFELKA
ncbi:AAA family ATPase [Guptibacillus hwajinpoensis]|uniref:AAA family ATPase n=1 Tax=Guptibacillus hwajinpoensis TaxID=208199 RepID=UPI001CFE9C44|nr:AAA family ATPase [Pseudalkalibacillus hwajinpoensis]WLR60636.1 hypothetical protein LC071_04575 [Pseudalkalibacillus hwajinpoensis]